MFYDLMTVKWFVKKKNAGTKNFSMAFTLFFDFRIIKEPQSVI